MHIQLESKLLEGYWAGLSDATDHLATHFLAGLQKAGEEDNGPCIFYVEDIHGLFTLAYEMGKDSNDANPQTANDFGRELYKVVATTSLTFDEWRKRYIQRKEVATAISHRRNNRARRLCSESGLDPNLLGIHPHNATVSRDTGNPWPGIDYAKVDACIHELHNEFTAFNAVSDWDREIRGAFDDKDDLPR
jgi:hypothetical protein